MEEREREGWGAVRDVGRRQCLKNRPGGLGGHKVAGTVVAQPNTIL